MNRAVRSLGLSVVALTLGVSLSACGSSAPAEVPQGSAAASASPTSEASASPTASLSPSEAFIKDVTTPKDLDLSGLVMPEEVKTGFPDGGAGVTKALETYVAASYYPELQKGSHINSEADLALFENLRPLMTPALHDVLKVQYLEDAGTAIVPNFSNFDGRGLKTMIYGAVKADDSGTVWQWGNEKAVAKKFTGSNGVDYVEVKIPVKFSFNTVSDHGVVSTYASRQYYFVPGANGEWLLEAILWSSADQRSSKDSGSLMNAKSPVDDM